MWTLGTAASVHQCRSVGLPVYDSRDSSSDLHFTFCCCFSCSALDRTCLRVFPAGPAHDKGDSGEQYQDHSSGLYPSFRSRCFSSSSLSYFCLVLLALMHPSRVLLEDFAAIGMMRMSTIINKYVSIGDLRKKSSVVT
jgi:hypothetical protein